MKFLILLLTLSASCGKTKTVTPVVVQSRNSNDDTSANTKTVLDWRESGELPSSFKLPPKSASLANEQRFVLKDSSNGFFLFNSDDKTVAPIAIPQNALRLIGSGNFDLTSESSAWAMSDGELRWVRWGTSEKELEITRIPLNSIFQDSDKSSVKLISVHGSSALLSSRSKTVHIRLEGNEKSLKEFELVVQTGLRASSFGHIFTTESEFAGLRRLLETEEPKWHKHQFQSENLPNKADFMNYEIGGTTDALRVTGVASFGRKLWTSQPASLGSTSEATTNSGTSTNPQEQKITKEAAALFIQYCAGCHEGRSPVFVSSSNGEKLIISQSLIENKEKVIRLMTLPSDDPKVMPPYGRPRPNAAELKVMSDL